MKVSIRLIIFVLTLGWLVAYAMATPLPVRGVSFGAPALASTPASGQTNNPASRPHGITAVNDFEPDAQGGDPLDGRLFQDLTYTNPSIAGLTFRTSWKTVEPTEGTFVWTKLDTVFDKAEQNGKWVELILIPGFGTPTWAVPFTAPGR